MPPTEGPLLAEEFGSRLGIAFEKYGQLCVGIDPAPATLLNWGLNDNLEGLKSFSKLLIKECVDRVGIVKPQVAFFERFGSTGFKVLEDLCLEARNCGLLVIADAKRGDIGSSMLGYSRAWLERTSPFAVDALTVSPYLGPESLNDCAQVAILNGKGLFVLAATSNPEASLIQKAGKESGTVAAKVAKFAKGLHTPLGTSLSSIGLVIGATNQLEEYGFENEDLESVPILAPGFGAQGASLSDLAGIFGNFATNVLCNVSRAIYEGGPAKVGLNIESAKLALASSTDLK